MAMTSRGTSHDFVMNFALLLLLGDTLTLSSALECSASSRLWPSDAGTTGSYWRSLQFSDEKCQVLKSDTMVMSNVCINPGEHQEGHPKSYILSSAEDDMSHATDPLTLTFHATGCPNFHTADLRTDVWMPLREPGAIMQNMYETCTGVQSSAAARKACCGTSGFDCSSVITCKLMDHWVEKAIQTWHGSRNCPIPEFPDEPLQDSFSAISNSSDSDLELIATNPHWDVVSYQVEEVLQKLGHCDEQHHVWASLDVPHGSLTMDGTDIVRAQFVRGQLNPTGMCSGAPSMYEVTRGESCLNDARYYFCGGNNDNSTGIVSVSRNTHSDQLHCVFPSDGMSDEPIRDSSEALSVNLVEEEDPGFEAFQMMDADAAVLKESLVGLTALPMTDEEIEAQIDEAVNGKAPSDWTQVIAQDWYEENTCYYDMDDKAIHPSMMGCHYEDFPEELAHVPTPYKWSSHGRAPLYESMVGLVTSGKLLVQVQPTAIDDVLNKTWRIKSASNSRKYLVLSKDGEIDARSVAPSDTSSHWRFILALNYLAENFSFNDADTDNAGNSALSVHVLLVPEDDENFLAMFDGVAVPGWLASMEGSQLQLQGSDSDGKLGYLTNDGKKTTLSEDDLGLTTKWMLEEVVPTSCATITDLEAITIVMSSASSWELKLFEQHGHHQELVATITVVAANAFGGTLTVSGSFCDCEGVVMDWTVGEQLHLTAYQIYMDETRKVMRVQKPEEAIVSTEAAAMTAYAPWTTEICMWNYMDSVEVRPTISECAQMMFDPDVVEDCTSSLWTWAGSEDTCPGVVNTKNRTCDEFCTAHERVCVKARQSHGICQPDIVESHFQDPTDYWHGCDQRREQQICVCKNPEMIMSEAPMGVARVEMMFPLNPPGKSGMDMLEVAADVAANMTMCFSKMTTMALRMAFELEDFMVEGMVSEDTTGSQAPIDFSSVRSSKLQKRRLQSQGDVEEFASITGCAMYRSGTGMMDMVHDPSHCCLMPGCVPAAPNKMFSDGSVCMELCKVDGSCEHSQWEVANAGICQPAEMIKDLQAGMLSGQMHAGVDAMMKLQVAPIKRNYVAPWMEWSWRPELLNVCVSPFTEVGMDNRKRLEELMDNEVHQQLLASQLGKHFINLVDNMLDTLPPNEQEFWTSLDEDVKQQFKDLVQDKMLVSLKLGWECKGDCEAALATVTVAFSQDKGKQLFSQALQDVLPAGTQIHVMGVQRHEDAFVIEVSAHHPDYPVLEMSQLVRASDLKERLEYSDLMSSYASTLPMQLSSVDLLHYTGITAVALYDLQQTTIEEVDYDMASRFCRFDASNDVDLLTTNTSFCDGIKQGEVCRVECHDGYARRCKDGSLDCGLYLCNKGVFAEQSKAICEMPCLEPPNFMPRMEMVSENGCSDMMDGATCDTQCSTGFIGLENCLEGGPCLEAQCHSFGWAFPAVYCPISATPTTCPMIPTPSSDTGTLSCVWNGQLVSNVAGVLVPFGTVCSYKCKDKNSKPDPYYVQYICAFAEVNDAGQTTAFYKTEDTASATAVTRMVPVEKDPFIGSITLAQGKEQTCVAQQCKLPLRLQGISVVRSGTELDGTYTARGGVMAIACQVGAAGTASVGSQCAPICDEGHTVDPTQSFKCDRSGDFHGSVACNIMKCLAEPKWLYGETGHAEARCYGRTHGQACQITCETGYSLDRTLSSYKCKNGEWGLGPQGANVSAFVPCVEDGCGDPPGVLNIAQSSIAACSNADAGFICPVKCAAGYTFKGKSQCSRGQYSSTGLGCVLSGVQVEILTVLTAAISMVADNSDQEQERTPREDAFTRVAAMIAGNPESAEENPANIGKMAAKSLLEENPELLPLDAILLVMDAVLDMGLSAQAALNAGIGALVSSGVTGVNRTKAAADIAEMAVKRGIPVSEVQQELAAAFVAQMDASGLAKMLSTSADATSTRVVASEKGKKEMEAVFGKQGRRLAEKTVKDVLAVAAVVGNELGNDTMAGMMRDGLIPTTSDMAIETMRVREGILLGGQPLLFADVAAAYAVSRLSGVTLESIGFVRESFELRNAVRDLFEGQIELAARSISLNSVAKNLISSGLEGLEPDAAAAAAYAVSLEAGLFFQEALQVAAATALHVQAPDFSGPSSCGENCQATNLIALSQAGRSAGKLAKIRSDAEAPQVATAAAWAAYGSGFNGSLHCTVAAAGAASHFGLVSDNMASLLKKVNGFLSNSSSAPESAELEAARLLGMVPKGASMAVLAAVETEEKATGETFEVGEGFGLVASRDLFDYTPLVAEAATASIAMMKGLSLYHARAAGAVARLLLAGHVTSAYVTTVISGVETLEDNLTESTIGASSRTSLLEFTSDNIAFCAAAYATSVRFGFEGHLSAAYAFGVTRNQTSALISSMSKGTSALHVRVAEAAQAVAPEGSSEAFIMALAVTGVLSTGSEIPGDALAAALLAVGANSEWTINYAADKSGELCECAGFSIGDLASALILAGVTGISQDANPVRQAAECLGAATSQLGEVASGAFYEQAAMSSACTLAYTRGELAYAQHFTELSISIMAGPLIGISALKGQEDFRTEQTQDSLVQSVQSAWVGLATDQFLSTGEWEAGIAAATYFAAIYEILTPNMSDVQAASAIYAQIEAAVGPSHAATAVSVAGYLAAVHQPKPDSWPTGAVTAAVTATDAVMSAFTASMQDSEKLQAFYGPKGCPPNKCPAENGFSSDSDCPVEVDSMDQSSCNQVCESHSSWHMPRRCIRAAPSLACKMQATSMSDAESCAAIRSDTAICVCSGPLYALNTALAATQGAARILSEVEAIVSMGTISAHVTVHQADIDSAKDRVANLSEGWNTSNPRSVSTEAVIMAFAASDSMTAAQALMLTFHLSYASGMNSTTSLEAVADAGIAIGISYEEALLMVPSIMSSFGLGRDEIEDALVNVGTNLMTGRQASSTLLKAIDDINLQEDEYGRAVERSGLLSDFENDEDNFLADYSLGDLSSPAGTSTAEAISDAVVSSSELQSCGVKMQAAFAGAEQAGYGTQVAAEAALRSCGENEEKSAAKLMTYLMCKGHSFGQAEMLATDAVYEMASGTVSATVTDAITASGQTLLGSSTLFYSSQLSWQPLAGEWSAPEMMDAKEGTVQSGYNGLDAKFMGANKAHVMVALARVFGVESDQVIIRSITDAIKRRLTGEPGRELLELAGCNIDFVIEIRAGDDAAKLQQMLRDFSDPASGLFAQFSEELTKILKENGINVPTGLSRAQVSTGNIFIDPAFTMAKSTWVVLQNWSNCSAVCGTGTRNRSLECSTGNLAACDKTAGGFRPNSTEECQAYTDCPWRWSCALGGPGNEAMSCDVQLALSAGIVLGPALIIAILVSIWCRIMLRRPHSGTLRLKNVQGGSEIKVNFSIVENPNSTSTQTVRETGEIISTNKMHVVWDIDVANTTGKEWDAEGYKLSVKQQPTTLADNPSMRQMVNQSAQDTLARITQELQKNEAEGNTVFDLSVEDTPAPPRTEFNSYVEDDRVEYFSMTHKKWVTAKVVSMAGLDRGGKECFNLVIGSAGQLRYMVPCDAMRLPLVSSEPVSVYSSKEGKWLHGVVDGTPHVAATTMGYNIRITGGSTQVNFIPNAPAARLRRRFPAETPIEVYRGQTLGWAKGKVTENAEVVDVPTYFEENPVVTPKGPNATSASLNEDRIHEGVESAGWFPVKVALDGGEAFEVSAHNLRIQSEWLSAKDSEQFLSV